MTSLITAASLDSAKAAGLRYVRDDTPGIRRQHRGRGVRYVGQDGKPVRDPEVLQRIKSLVIPPAWTQVWICPLANGHLQATGIDSRGRKQYLYHPLWRQVRDEAKFDRLAAFAQALSRIRRRVARDLKAPGLSEKLLATIVRLLETTYIRVGNEEYVQQNESFGLTTLRSRHVKIAGSRVRFEFRGKSGIRHAVDLEDRRLARILRSCQELPGQELFQYVDSAGERHSIDSGSVNEYLHAITGQTFTAKDFRTWAGTVLAWQALESFEEFTSVTQAKKNLLSALDAVSRRLGNTRSICRKCYVHPSVVEAYLNGRLKKYSDTAAGLKIYRSPLGLRPNERKVLAFLEELAKGNKQRRRTRPSSRNKMARPQLPQTYAACGG